MSKFSDFIRDATPEEKEAVYMDVMKKATELQNAMTAPDELTSRLREQARRERDSLEFYGSENTADMCEQAATRIAHLESANAELLKRHKSIMKNHDDMMADYITSNNALHRQVEELRARCEAMEGLLKEARTFYELNGCDADVKAINAALKERTK
jgi:CHAD domain-containing protein